MNVVRITTFPFKNSPNYLDRTTTDELPQSELLRSNRLRRRPQMNTLTKTERKHRNDTKKPSNRTNSFGLLRIFYGDEYWRSGTPRIEATERNERTSSKPNYKGWLRPNDLRIRCRTYANDCFGFLRRRRRLRKLLEAKRLYGPAVKRRDRSSLPKKTNFLSERPSSFASLSEHRRNRTRSNQFK